MGYRDDIKRAVGMAAALAAILTVIVAALALCGCSWDVKPDAQGWPDSEEFSSLESGALRFSAHDADDGGSFGTSAYVIVDRQTGVEYFMIRIGSGLAITPLLEADGTPVTVSEKGE